ncbi:GDP-mannose--glycolipid 4-beta-D-mannosyltransferase [soil metagenome]
MSAKPTIRVLGWPGLKARQNPYNRLLYTAMVDQGAEVDDFTLGRLLLGHFDVLHLHWPNFRFPHRGASWREVRRSLYNAALVMVGLVLSRLRRQRSVWTIHNLQAHDTRFRGFARIYDRTMVRLIHGHISLSASAQSEALTCFPELVDRPGFVIPHGHYRDSYSAPIPRSEARERLGLPVDSTIFLAFGLIRPYKNLVPLIEAFRAAELPGAVLLVAGKPVDADISRAVRAAAASATNVKLALRFIPDGETHLYFSAADVAVNPAANALNSGSALLSLSFGVPLLMVNSGVARDLRLHFGSEYVHLFDQSISADALHEVQRRIQSTNRLDLPLEALDQISWPAIAQKTLIAFESLRRPSVKGALVTESQNLLIS